ncbi:hypothetical protein SVEN_1814 [Streptomyces venezuelae ATCC 10712]|uniref:Uncharacterized protein n=1 Tax=Streptomyces venezuelae (strain ATCC 10712 / CBS 650.69 / DSM 40230 / JCM 4526 / NBRC 13096 / PD 04745) TaxID=953739 RepID=F2RIB8_STRVP|nr:hypothetical protein SVEN_1814 [Streptomyces venezuelae ATCC 10712]
MSPRVSPRQNRLATHRQTAERTRPTPLRKHGVHPFGDSDGALGTLPARPQIASSRVWSA